MSNEIKVGILTLVSIAILFIGYKYLSGKRIFQSQQAFVVHFDNVNGLLPGNPINLNGVKVGTIESLNLNQDGLKTSVTADVLVDDNIAVPKGTTFNIVGDLLGDRYIELVYPKTGPLVLAQNGDVMQGALEKDLSASVKEELLPIKAKAEELFGSLDSLLIISKNVLGSENMEGVFNNINTSFESINGTLKNLRKVSVELNGLIVEESDRLHNILDHVEAITKNFDDNGAMITKIMQNTEKVSENMAQMDLKKTSDELTSTITNASNSLAEISAIMDKVNKGEGSLGLLLKDEGLYHNLESASNNLDKLFTHVQENPGKYVHFSVFGRKDKDKKKKEKKQ